MLHSAEIAPIVGTSDDRRRKAPAAAPDSVARPVHGNQTLLRRQGRGMKPAPSVDPRCKDKMTEYISQHWIKELTEKYESKTCEDYDAFKTEVMSKLGEKEFQTFGEGEDSYECCVEYCAGISACGPPSLRPPSGHLGGPDSGPPHYDRQIFCGDPYGAYQIQVAMSSKDGLSLTYVMGQLEPEECKPPSFAQT